MDEDLDLSDDGDGDGNWEEIDEDVNESTMCIFCQKLLTSVDNMFIHCKEAHKFSIHTFAKNWKMNSVDFIKFVNFVRVNVSTVNC